MGTALWLKCHRIVKPTLAATLSPIWNPFPCFYFFQLTEQHPWRLQSISVVKTICCEGRKFQEAPPPQGGTVSSPSADTSSSLSCSSSDPGCGAWTVTLQSVLTELFVPCSDREIVHPGTVHLCPVFWAQYSLFLYPHVPHLIGLIFWLTPYSKILFQSHLIQFWLLCICHCPWWKVS